MGNNYSMWEYPRLFQQMRTIRRLIPLKKKHQKKRNKKSPNQNLIPPPQKNQKHKQIYCYIAKRLIATETS